MVWLVWLWYPFSDIVQKTEEPKCLTRKIKQVEELQEILSDVMLKTTGRGLSKTPEGLSVLVVF